MTGCVMTAPENQIRTDPKPRCLLCGVEGVGLYQDLGDPYFGAPGRWDVKRCPSPGCGLIWLDPAPLAEDLHLAYQQYFTHGNSDGIPTGADRLRDLLFRIYQLTAAIPAALVGLQQSRRDLAMMYLGDLPAGKALDVGCGDGRFLNRLRKAGWAVDGVDFDAKAIATAKSKYGLDLRHGDLASAKFEAGTFDAVTLSHVIEHVPDPIALLGEVRRVLKPGGRIVITTPNGQSRGHREFQAHWFGLDAPRHLHIFSPSSLSEAGRRTGFRILKAASTAASADVFIGASYSIRNSPGHQTTHQPPPSIGRTLKAVGWQYREHFALRHDPCCGEEALLIGVKE